MSKDFHVPYHLLRIVLTLRQEQQAPIPSVFVHFWSPSRIGRHEVAYNEVDIEK
jgi:hypothetical protein